MSGVVAKRIPLDNLRSCISDGWRELNSEIAEAVAFVKDNFESSELLMPLSEYNFPHKRGAAGNNGASDLLFFDSRDELYNVYRDKKNLRLKPAMRNAKLNSFDICGGDTKFLDIEDNDENLIDAILDTYLDLPEREGRRKKKAKNMGK